MRIAHWIRALVAVLGLAAVYSSSIEQHHNSTIFSSSRTRRSNRKHNNLHEGWYDSVYKHSVPLEYPGGKFLTHRENRALIKWHNGSAVDCCPSVLEMIEPNGGKNQDDEFVELYRSGEYRQRFYELSCHQEVLNQHCRFMERKMHAQSRCVQKYSYTYALVKDPGRHRPDERPKNFPSFPSPGPDGATWTLDYIRVRSGCGCVVTQKRKGDRHKKARAGDDVSR